MKAVVSFLCIILFGTLQTAHAFSIDSSTAQTVFGWNFLNFTFQNNKDAQNYINNKYYEDCVLAGVKVDLNGNYYVSVPRWRDHVPATLSKVVFQDGQYLLQPYPSWEMNQIGDPDALQSVLGFEIDPKNRIWILDQGKVSTKPAIPGSIKLVVYDLNTNTQVFKYAFSEAEASVTQSFLNDVVVDMKNNFAYITDSGIGYTSTLHPALLIVDVAHHKARRVLSSVNSTLPDPSLWININGQPVLTASPMETGADGIALTPDTTLLYYTPLTSHVLFGIPTSILRNFAASEKEIENSINFILDKGCASDGLAYSNNGLLYIGSLEGSSVYSLDIQNNNANEVTWNTIAEDNQIMVWPDTFGFDHQGNLVYVTNYLNTFLDGNMTFTETEFRIWSVYVNGDSYMTAV